MSTLHTQRSIRLLPFMLLFLLASCTTTKAPEKTGLLKPEVGYTGDLIGAEIKAIKQDPDENVTMITVLIPENPEAIETVRVVDKDGNRINTVKAYEFSKDAEGQPNGIIIYLSKPLKFAFRLQFNDEQ